MTEMEKVEYARSFIDKLANGINPLDDTPVSENDIVSNERLSRCFSYVSDVLGQIVENERRKEKLQKRKKRIRFTITAEQLMGFEYSKTPITFNEFCNKMEALVDMSGMRHLSRSTLPRWLLSIGLLNPPGPREKHYTGGPTPEGEKLGITRITYTTKYGERACNALGIEAQIFVVDNIHRLMAFRDRYHAIV